MLQGSRCRCSSISLCRYICTRKYATFMHLQMQVVGEWEHPHPNPSPCAQGEGLPAGDPRTGPERCGPWASSCLATGRSPSPHHPRVILGLSKALVPKSRRFASVPHSLMSPSQPRWPEASSTLRCHPDAGGISCPSTSSSACSLSTTRIRVSSRPQWRDLVTHHTGSRFALGCASPPRSRLTEAEIPPVVGMTAVREGCFGASWPATHLSTPVALTPEGRGGKVTGWLGQRGARDASPPAQHDVREGVADGDTFARKHHCGGNREGARTTTAAPAPTVSPLPRYRESTRVACQAGRWAIRRVFAGRTRWCHPAAGHWPPPPACASRPPGPPWGACRPRSGGHRPA